LDGKRRRWLHSSIAVRTSAIIAFQRTILAFGVDPRGKLSGVSGSSSSNSLSDVERAIAVVGGCLVEQLTWTSDLQLENGEWGSIAERKELVVASADSLSVCLTSGGEYLSAVTRNLVESIARFSLSSATSPTSTPVLSAATVKAACLSFAISVVSTPWPDGAGSQIDNELRFAAERCQHDREASVSIVAAYALTACNKIANPRVPSTVLDSKFFLRRLWPTT
jgi:hypothetical protein